MLSAWFATANDVIKNSAQSACGSSCGTDNLNQIFASVANAMIFIVGAVSVIMIIVAGLRYATANGDAKATESAKNTILYAAIGIVVAVSAYAIVTFVTGRIK